MTHTRVAQLDEHDTSENVCKRDNKRIHQTKKKIIASRSVQKSG